MRPPGSLGWWGAKVRQAWRHVGARVASRERDSLGTWLRPAELELFDAMHVADRRHGLDVVEALRRDGVAERDVLVAGLLHDAGKGRTGLVPRVLFSLGQAYPPFRAAGRVPGIRRSMARLRNHAITSADLAAAAGCSDRTVGLIRWQEDPRDAVDGERLRLADEAN